MRVQSELPGLRRVIEALPVLLVAASTLLPLGAFLGPLAGSLGLSYSERPDGWFFAYVVACTLGFAVGFVTARDAGARGPVAVHAVPAAVRYVVPAALALAAIGVLATVLTVPANYGARLAELASSGASDPNLREEVVGSTSVSGLVRMLTFLSPAAFALLLAAYDLHGRRLLRQVGWWWAFALAFAAVVFRAAVFLDRNSIALAVFLSLYVGIHRLAEGERDARPLLVAAACTGLVAAGLMSLQALVRGGELRETNTILNYADLGMANASLAFDSTWRFGFGTDTVLSPLTVVPRAMGLPDLPLAVANNAWVHSPAANMLTYAYADYGSAAPLFYALVGVLAGLVQRARAGARPTLGAAVLHLWVLYALAVLWTVPITRGPDYWCGLIASLVAAWAAGHERGAGRRIERSLRPARN